jgi:hypothetical protein
MKKLSVIAIGILLGITLGATAFADIDSASLQNQTSEGLFDRTDPYDLALTPGLMYQLDLWRLYTNLSGYDGGDAYLIGTSGPLGPGSLSVFYEQQKGRFIESTYNGWDFDWESGWHSQPPPNPVPNYDGIPDYVQSGDLTISEDVESDEHNFHMAYGGDFFDGISLGLSYAPQFYKRDGTPEGIFSGSLEDLDIAGVASSTLSAVTGLPLLVGLPFQRHNPMQGLPWLGKDFTFVYSSLSYTTNDYQSWNQTDVVVQTNSTFEDEDTIHPFNLQSHMRFGEDWDILAGITFADIDRGDTLRASAVGNFNLSTFTNQALTGYTRGDGVLTLDGSWEEAQDGKRWGVYVSPSYQMSDLIGFRLDLGYAKEDGDNRGGGVLTVDGMTEFWNAATPPNPETNTIEGAVDMSYNGDYDVEDILINPRITLNYDVAGRQMRWSMGVGYMRSHHEWDGVMRRDAWYVATFNDGDLVVLDPSDTTTWANFTGYDDFVGEETTTVWSFPVATEFWMTERLRGGLGCKFERQNVDYEERGGGPWLENEYYYTARADGSYAVGDVGPNQYLEYTGDPFPTPYDADNFATWYQDKRETTVDYTTYNIGLGYLFSEHLQVDLMWTGKGEDGGVDVSEVFASATLTF